MAVHGDGAAARTATGNAAIGEHEAPHGIDGDDHASAFADPDAESAAVHAHGHGHGPVTGKRLAGLSIAAVGIVFGDIGTSPLYALKETFHGHYDLQASRANVIGVLSLILWSFVVIVTVKYLLLVMRADNKGEGGILALTSLITPSTKAGRRRTALILFGLFGTALLYGDGIITPAISVLSAVEGTAVATPSLSSYVVPIAVVILVGLFAIQKRGTDTIGKLFGPVMVTWFLVLALLGISHLADDPEIFTAINPAHGFEYFLHNGMAGFLSLGSVILVVTGGEALYADMGHFGRKPIKYGWFAIVFPCLVLNYFGQGAMLLAHPETADQPFFKMAPSWGLIPLVVLATLATIIASQALISGVFSLSMQAVQLGYLPRLNIAHTSASSQGQIYIPAMNWSLMVACVALVAVARSSTALASAYGLAVAATMAVTTILFLVVLIEKFRWPRPLAFGLCGLLLVVDLAFLGANIFKIPSGGWFPLVVAIAILACMTTWRTGRRIVGEYIHRNDQTLDEFVTQIAGEGGPVRVPGTAVYLFSQAGLTPPALKSNVKHNRSLHDQLIVLSIETADVPRVEPWRRSEVADLGNGITQVVLRYGFMEEPNVPQGLTEGDAAELCTVPDMTTYFLGAESLRVTERKSMAPWRERLFALMTRNATPAAFYFGLDPEKTVTLSQQVDF